MRYLSDIRVLFRVAAAAVIAAASLPAATIVLGGGTTTVSFDPTVLSVLSGAGINITTFGAATLVGADATFPITGGTLDDTSNDAEIEHEGSGLTFSNGVNSLTLANFIIDANLTPGSMTGSVLADVSGFATATDAPVFDISNGPTLSFTSTAASVFTQAFGLDDVTGVEAATADVDAQPIPEPSTILLAAAGLGLLAVRRRAGQA